MGVKIVPLKPSILFRVTALEYYKIGLSPAGARKAAGRFNTHDMSALYLSFDHDTALKEYYRADPPRPAVVLPVEVSADYVVELGGKLGNWPTFWRDWNCDWTVARDAVVAGNLTATCSSWLCGKDVVDRNCAGIIFPSMQNPGGKNLVLFSEHAPTTSFTYKVHDPRDEIRRANPVKRRKPTP